MTTNGCLKSNGDAVMGAGLALQFAKRFPSLPKQLGMRIKSTGNHCYIFKISDQVIMTLPTKHDWRNMSTLALIERSVIEAKILADKYNFSSILMTPPGCGLGGLEWEVVEQVLREHLDDRFTVLVKER